MTTIGVFANIFNDEGHILCVKRAYGPKNWTTPGGRLDPGETPCQALAREVLEESGYVVRPGQLVGVYSRPARDDLVLSINAEILERIPWQPDGEIAECDFYPLDGLPQPMLASTLRRITDAFERRVGVLRVFEG